MNLFWRHRPRVANASDCSMTPKDPAHCIFWLIDCFCCWLLKLCPVSQWLSVFQKGKDMFGNKRGSQKPLLVREDKRCTVRPSSVLVHQYSPWFSCTSQPDPNVCSQTAASPNTSWWNEECAPFHSLFVQLEKCAELVLLFHTGWKRVKGA